MDQAETLRRLASGRDGGARLVAVTSGKGGVGKTSLAANLALVLGGMGRKVLLVDVDIGLANADVVLGVEPRRNLADVLKGEVGLEDAMIEAAPGVELLAGSSALATTSDLDEEDRTYIVNALRKQARRADYVFVDTGAGISRNVVRFAAAADEVLVVTSPEPTAITDAYALIKVVSREKGYGRFRLAVNQAVDFTDGARVAERIRTVSRRFLGLEVEYLGCVVTDPRVSLAVRRKRPFVLEYPRSPASECVRELALRLLGGGGAPAPALAPRARAFDRLER